MKVLLYGHSYVRKLEQLGNWNREITLNNGGKVDCQFLFKAFPGEDYDYFLNNPQEFHIINLIKPDVVVVILGGNSIVNSVSNSAIKLKATEFYTKLREVVDPLCLRLAVQVEPRFSKAGNKFGTPEAEEFNQRKQIINNHVNKTVKRNKLVEGVILLGSVNYLNDSKYFVDGVHLNKIGLQMYRDAILGGLKYALDKQQ